MGIAHRRRDVRMTQTLLPDFDGCVESVHKGSRRVTERVEASARNPEALEKRVMMAPHNVVRPERRPLARREQEI